MQDNTIFLDSNIVIYAYFKQEERKQRIAKQLISESSVISTQVLQEMSNTLRRKMKVDFQTIKLLLEECITNSEVFTNTTATVFSACDVAARYGFSFYDSLIIAAAMDSGCTTLYSEDLQHSQTIDGKLIIKNPFI